MCCETGEKYLTLCVARQVKTSMMNYLQGLIAVMDPSDFVNTMDTRLAVSRIINWTMEPRNTEVRKVRHVCLSVCVSVLCLSVSLSACMVSVCLSVSFLSMCLSVCIMSVCLSALRQSVCLSASFLSVCLSVSCLSVCLSVHHVCL